MYLVDINLFAKNEKDLEFHIQTISIYNEDIGMEIGIKICHAYNENQKKKNNGRNRTAKSRKIRKLVEKETYKYLGMLEADGIKQVEMKEKLFKKEYLRRMIKLLETKHCCRNFIKGKNTWAVPLVRYYLPTPPLGQDMTQGQFLSGV